LRHGKRRLAAPVPRAISAPQASGNTIGGNAIEEK
jgi:hypothetical protein